MKLAKLFECLQKEAIPVYPQLDGFPNVTYCWLTGRLARLIADSQQEAINVHD